MPLICHELDFVDMYLSYTKEAVIVVRLFSIESSLRVVVATMAFGLEVDCPNVRQAVVYGLPSILDLLSRRQGERDKMVCLA